VIKLEQFHDDMKLALLAQWVECTVSSLSDEEGLDYFDLPSGVLLQRTESVDLGNDVDYVMVRWTAPLNSFDDVMIYHLEIISRSPAGVITRRYRTRGDETVVAA
jgi:hypothetical protein